MLNLTSSTNYAYAFMFFALTNSAFAMTDDFNIDPTIAGIVGDGFATSMFSGCTGDSFAMGESFNMPQEITEVGDYFASDMFGYCSGYNFTMGESFNMPQNITAVGDYFAANMFIDCQGASFTMGDSFNLPQEITEVSIGFSYRMFKDCRGSAFRVNEGFKFPHLDTGEVDKANVFNYMFADVNATQTTYAADIINGNDTPNQSSQTFSDAFPDYYTIAENWKESYS
jgi:hypothetical protein